MDALRVAKKVAARKRAADQALREAINAALDAGCSMREVASAVGLSPTRVHQIRHEEVAR